MGMPPQDGPRGGEQQPPPSAYHPQPPANGYQPTPPYQAAQQQYQPQGNFPSQGFSPYGYPPHMFPGAPYGQGPFFGYPGAFPSQQSRPQDKPDKTAPRKKSPPRGRSKSPRRTQQNSAHPKSPSSNSREDRQRDGTVEDIQSSVKPMRSAFHFFVNDMQDKLRQVALEEVKRSTQSEEVDLYLLNTNLNSRLMKEWEDAEQSVRDAYMDKEEADRKRFMADDEIASRHCATLTARARSPRYGANNRKGQKNEDDDDDDDDDEGSFGSGGSMDDDKKRDSPTENDESPTKKSRTQDDAADE